MRKFLIAFFISLLPFCAFSKNIKIDSLLNLLTEDLVDTLIVDVLNELSWEYHRNDLEKSYDYAQQALKEAQRINYEKGEARAYNLLAIIYSFKGEDNLAIEANLKCLEIARRINSLYHIGIATNDLGISYSGLNDNEKALEFYQESLAIAQATDDTLGICFTLGNIGLLHSDEQNYDLAESYFKQVIDLGIQASDQLVVGMAYANLGYIEANKSVTAKARAYFKKSMEIALEMEDRLSYLEMQIALANLNLQEKKYELAEAAFKSILIEIKEFGLNEEMAIYPFLALSQLYQQQDEFYKSVESAQNGYKLAIDQSDIRYQADFSKLLSELYESTGELAKALYHQRTYSTLSDSIYSEEKTNKVMELESKYQIQQKELENKLLVEAQLKGQIMLKQKSLMNYFSFFVLIVFAIGLLLLWRNNKRKHDYNIQLEREVQNRTKDLLESNKRLADSNVELERFAYIASHDLKEPLRNISGFSRLIDHSLSDVDRPKVKEYLTFVKSNTLQMHRLIEDVLEYSKLQKVEGIEKVDVNDCLGAVLKSLEPVIKERKANIMLDDFPDIWSNRTQLFQLFKNLIENGIKYNESDTVEIKVTHQSRDNHHYFSVIDNGIGIEVAYQSQVFEMFKRLHNRAEYQGSGLGLSIVKKIVEKLGGEIKLESTLGKGSTFSFCIPDKIAKKRTPEQFIAHH